MFHLKFDCITWYYCSEVFLFPLDQTCGLIWSNDISLFCKLQISQLWKKKKKKEKNHKNMMGSIQISVLVTDKNMAFTSVTGWYIILHYIISSRKHLKIHFSTFCHQGTERPWTKTFMTTEGVLLGDYVWGWERVKRVLLNLLGQLEKCQRPSV